jgi:hypothetical protein
LNFSGIESKLETLRKHCEIIHKKIEKEKEKLILIEKILNFHKNLWKNMENGEKISFKRQFNEKV